MIGIALWFCPHSAGIPEAGWHLLAIFLATIAGIICKPLPMGALAIVAMSVAILTKTLSLEGALSGFQNSISWLVVFAFFISRGFIKTGLGKRIAFYFVSIFGKKSLGLSYGLLISELILAPAIPSVTARTGGVIFPVARGIAESFGSSPEMGTRRRMGSFLLKVCFQGSIITSAMFLTAMAANPLISGLTKEAGYTISWATWAKAAFLPGMLSLICMPFILYKLYPPEIHHTPDAAAFAKKQLTEMGPFSLKEWCMLFVFITLLILWIFGSLWNVNATAAAAFGLAMLLLLQILSWDDVISEKNAWDTFIWFSILITLASQLTQLGFTPWFSSQIVRFVGDMHWGMAFSLLTLIYFYSHYFFASSTAHVGAMYPTFLLVALALGTPPTFAILVLAYASSLMGGLTHYGSGPAPLYFGSGYIEIKEWWSLGFFLSIVYIILWFGVGSLWWKFLGLW